MTIDAFDEFAHLQIQASEFGIADPVPTVTRVTETTDEGHAISALRFGTGPVEVTFAHGAGLNAHTWDMTAIALARPSLGIDLPGHGDSSWYDDGMYLPRRLAADVAAVLPRWVDRPQVLVGHSLGGLTSAAIAAQHPELVRALVLVDITPGIDRDHGPEELRRFFEVTEFADREEALDRALAFGLGSSREATARGVYLNTRVRDDGVVEWKHHFARLAQALTQGDGQGAPILNATGWDDPAGVRCPVLLVRGEQGYIDEPALAEFRERVPQAEIVAVPSHHNVQEVVPAHLAQLINEFADR